MISQKPDIQAIFSEAILLAPEEGRGSFLDDVCGNDVSTRSRVDALLRAHSAAGGFFGGQVAADVASEVHLPIAEGPGTVIGPYKLLRQIGDGGMGVVFIAEQTEPIRRTVALKIIKPGMDTQQVIARFKAERQALALMDHPHIAKVLGAGSTETGRPYFLMELVSGKPITDHCAERQLSTRQRVEIMVQVCHGVQHAHQKGIIHRDIKPSNVLVSEYGGVPVPKIIDFGVAKAVGQSPSEHTMVTRLGQIVGTFEYMSPEQAEFSPTDVDTRSDIYALGVLLYQVLTGTTPFERQRLQTLTYDETLRVIREVEPPLPSTRISSLRAGRPNGVGGGTADHVTTAHGSAQAGAERNVDLARLHKEVRGDLDWIVMKCLEKDRDDRYTTADSLAADLLRYLAHEPITANRASSLTRGRKFIRRHRAVVFAAAAVSIGLVAAIVGTSIALVSQSRQREIADRERTQAELNLAAVLQSQWKYGDAEQLYRKALERSTAATPEERQQAARTLLRLAGVVQNANESEQLYPQAIAAIRAAFLPSDPNLAHALTRWALVLREQKRHAEVEPLFREAYQILRTAEPRDHFATGASAAHYGNALHVLGRYSEALPVLEESVAEYEKSTPRNAGAIAMARLELGRNLAALGRFQEAEGDLLDVYNTLSATRVYHSGALALAGLYTSWNEAEPGKGHDIEAQKYIRKALSDFIFPNSSLRSKPPLSEPGESTQIHSPSSG